MTVRLMIGLTAKADDRPVPVIVHEEMGMPVPFPNRNFADVLTQDQRAPSGRVLIRVGNAKNRELQDPHLEKRLDDIEKKLDRVLKELKNRRRVRPSRRR